MAIQKTLGGGACLASGTETSTIKKNCFHGFTVSAALPPTKKLFQFGKMLGRGAYGSVYQAKCQNGCEIAIKEVAVDSLKFEMFAKKQLECLQHLKNNPKHNLICFFGFFNEGRHRYFVFEKGGDNLAQLISKKINFLTVEDFNEISHQLFAAAQQLHQLKIQYGGDYKFENMVFFEKERVIKLIDFENSHTEEKDRPSDTTKVLHRVSFELINLQLKILHKCNNFNYLESSYKLITYSCDDDCDMKMLELRSDQDIWLSDIPDRTRDFLIKCFSKDKKILEELLEKETPFYPRSSLDVFAE
ncbi:protein kinase [Sansalvadorimonas sp. 2012CJ34-2]|uniref:Protein kinase n=1 Tax=Parendozoicomonas callyspongiae TaxID=2942213 RepID=A0ABT0PIL5_9GAMM|nr:protein kinase [Sansalvadorimonas sp. 2012CJ34-2]MCL6271227.1 protein kinase [Sansalvadorimonas sp. 2012CJ34-2]